MGNRRRITIAIVLVAIAALSFAVIGSWAASPDTYDGSMQTLEDVQGQALAMTASATALATAAALVPGDATSPIANKLMDLSGYMVLVYVFITLEKYLLTLTGGLAFKILIPLGLILIVFAVTCFSSKETMWNFMTKLAAKMIIAALLFWALVPVSLLVTNVINDTYDYAYSDEAASEIEEDSSGFSLGAKVSEKIDELEDAMNKLIEGIAVMIVTTCVIPICVLLLFLLIIRSVTGLNFAMPSVAKLPKASKIVGKLTDSDDDDIDDMDDLID